MFRILLLLPLLLVADESFITKYEYGKMLYKNPRGIGCNKCHGDSGEGQKIASYKHKKQSKELSAPQINSLDFDDFRASFEKKKKIMPKYYLTSMELEALYEYLKKSRESLGR